MMNSAYLRLVKRRERRAMWRALPRRIVGTLAIIAALVLADQLGQHGIAGVWERVQSLNVLECQG